MKCPKCNRELPAEARFCLHCGTQLETLLSCSNRDCVIYGCPILPKDAKFCPECGNPVEGSASDVGECSDGSVKKFTVNGVSFKMIAVEGGTFHMGSNDGESESDEKPVHSVTLSRYYIGQTEVTQALWKAVMGGNPSCFTGDNLPVEKVSWYDCQEFISRLNQLTGEKFRLPTEAEWEFAARGGNQSKGYIYSGSNEIDDVAWYRDNASCETQPVATKQANELGIYDMSGNVWEWCQDWYGSYSSSAQTNPTGPTSGCFHVLRGGCWNINVERCHAAYRDSDIPSLKSTSVGLRLAL